MLGALPLFLWATAKPLHPEPQNVPSAVQSEPSPQWAAAVGRARQIVRAVLSEQNLPGLSVAVGVGGEIVWAATDTAGVRACIVEERVSGRSAACYAGRLLTEPRA